MTMLRRLFAGLLLTCFAAPAGAWGFYAHTVTADIAERNIEPDTKRAVEALFAYEDALGTPECPLSNLQEASVWPDCVRREGWRWGYTAAWHYRTAPICEPYNPRANCSGGSCVTGQIERSLRLLADETLPGHIRLEALAFVVHFIGDVHMPLHSGDKDDRGGNDREADYGIVPSLNLHWIWDGPLAERAITSARPALVRRYDAVEKAQLGGGDPAEWGRESWSISRDFIYPQAFDTDAVCDTDLPDETALTQDDIVRAIPVSQQRVTQAGIRIAEALELAMAPGPLPVSED